MISQQPVGENRVRGDQCGYKNPGGHTHRSRPEGRRPPEAPPESWKRTSGSAGWEHVTPRSAVWALCPMTSSKRNIHPSVPNPAPPAPWRRSGPGHFGTVMPQDEPRLRAQRAMAEKLRPQDSNVSRAVDQPLRAVRPTPTVAGPDLREALAVVWLRKWSILAITLLIASVALLMSSRQPPIYESTVRILVLPVESVGADPVPLREPNLATETELVKSVAVAEIVAENLDFPGPPRDLLGSLSVHQPTDTEILELGYRHPDPREAQRMATAFAAAYLEYRTGTVTEAIVASATNTQEQIALLTEDFNRINQRLQELSSDDPNRGLLEAQANLLSTQIVQLQLELVSLPEEVTVGRVIQPAAIPGSPVSPNHFVNAVFGLVVGLGVGVGLAFLRDRLSERLRSSEEAEAYLEAPVLGVIPRIPSWRWRKDPLLVSAVQWRSPSAEAYRVLRTNLLSVASAVGAKSIAVTSAHAGEGKSATVANLGVVLARAGKRVALVSGDLRRPRLHEFFEREGDPGFIEVLAGQATLEEALQQVTLPMRGFDTPSAGLLFLPSGRVSEDPTELITSDNVGRVIRALEDDSDIVLIDLPPVLPVTDALVVAAVAENVLLVIGPKASTRPAVTSVRQQLDRVGARILGGVLNGPVSSLVPTSYSY
jgi:capsular exopolysaccharide synthesis family protein